MPDVLLLGGRAPVAADHARRFAGQGWNVHVADSVSCRVTGWSRAVRSSTPLAPPRHDPAGFVAGLARTIRRHGIDLVVPNCEEVFYLSRYRHLLPASCRVLADDFDKLRALHSKWEFLQLADACGGNPPPSARVRGIGAARGRRALIVRAGDYFGPRTGNSWFAQGLVKPGRPVRRVANPAAPGVGHQWSYLPDVAATMVALVERRTELAPFARFHMAGHWDPDGTAMCDAIRRVVARRGGAATVAAFPWWLIRLLTPFNETLREMYDMRYLWREPVRMDNRRLVDVLGAEPHTPLDVAVERTLEGLGCLPVAAQANGVRVAAR